MVLGPVVSTHKHMLYPHIFSCFYFNVHVCLYQSIKTHVRFSPLDTIHQNPGRDKTTGSDLYDSRWFQPQFGNHQYLTWSKLFSSSHRGCMFLLFDFWGSEELLGFFWFLGYLLHLFLVACMAKRNWYQWCHGSTKPKYKSNYVVCLATSSFTNSICILLQKIAICHRCVFLSKEFLHPKCAS